MDIKLVTLFPILARTARHFAICPRKDSRRHCS
jgi:hypothetical protein